MSRKAPRWRCRNWMNGVTCERPHADNRPGSKKYDVRRFASRRSYELSDLHPSQRSKARKSLGGMKRYRTSRPGASMKVHRLRVRAAGRLPSTATGVLSAVPRTSRSDPFESARHWSNGTLPSFKSLGAIGKGAYGGIVIYSDETFKRHHARN